MSSLLVISEVIRISEFQDDLFKSLSSICLDLTVCPELLDVMLIG